MKKEPHLKIKDAREIWKKKYGASFQKVEAGILPFLQHQSVRQFSPKPVSENTIKSLFAAAQSASSSANLQLWSAVSVQNPTARKKLAKACGNQRQILECSWFFVFLADHYRADIIAKQHGVQTKALKLTEFYTMATIDAAIAAERMACAAESLGLGICYIGAIRNKPSQIKSTLKLPPKTFAIFGLCIGVPFRGRLGEIKPRFDQKAVWSRETYNRNPNILEYDSRASEYYSKIRGIETNWSRLSARRLRQALTDERAHLKKWLKLQGFGLD